MCCSPAMTGLKIITTSSCKTRQGRVLARARLPEGIAGITRLHALIGQFAGPDTEPR